MFDGRPRSSRAQFGERPVLPFDKQHSAECTGPASPPAARAPRIAVISRSPRWPCWTEMLDHGPGDGVIGKKAARRRHVMGGLLGMDAKRFSA